MGERMSAISGVKVSSVYPKRNPPPHHHHHQHQHQHQHPHRIWTRI